MSDHWARVEQILQSALSRPVPDREQYVRDVCADEPGIAAEVLALLAHADSADGFLERPGRAPLAAGQRLGAYEVREHIGTGGMGEVYRVTDTRLRRDVALKLLPPEAADAERRERFAREAQAVASLNHPGIVTIHSIEQSGDQHFLTMELVDGRTLDALIPPRGLSTKALLAIAVPLADAVGAAHARGVVHRDLKPGNVMVTPDGRVKVLDFGLAKFRQTNPVSDHATTKVGTITADGRILGTVAYMSPEQAEGKDVDHRTDVFSLGVLLYELATGGRPFKGESRISLMASIVRDTPPPVTDVRPELPAGLARVIARCLAKDPAKRFQSVLDLRNDLEDIGSDMSASASAPAHPFAQRSRPIRTRVLQGAGVALLAGAAIAGYLLWPHAAQSGRETSSRFMIQPPSGVRVVRQDAVPLMAISPDGVWLAYQGTSSDPARRGLFLHSTRDIESRLIRDEMHASPFFSPDSHWLGFWSNGALWKVPVAGGDVQRICDAPDQLRGASWGDDGRIVFISAGDKRLQQVKADGGQPAAVTKTTAADVRFYFPQVLPGSRAVLAMRLPDREVVVVSLADGTVIRELAPGTYPRYLPEGWVVFRRASRLYAAPFDLQTLALSGEPRAVFEGVPFNPGGSETSSFDLSATGDLFYTPPLPRVEAAQLSWLTRAGGLEPVAELRQDYDRPLLDPEGRRIAVSIAKGGDSDLWVYEIASKTWAQLTHGLTTFDYLVWSPDGKWIVFSSKTTLSPRLYRVASSGGEPLELTRTAEYGAFKVAYDVATSVYGNTVVFYRQVGANDFDLLTMPLDPPGVPTPYLRLARAIGVPRVSPDGRWLAYTSNELRDTDRQLMIRPFVAPERFRKTVAAPGGPPHWSRDGRTIFYLQGGTIWAVKVTPGRRDEDLQLGAPERVVSTSALDIDTLTSFQPSTDGQKFLIVNRPAPAREERLLVYVPKWVEAMKAEYVKGARQPVPASR